MSNYSDIMSDGGMDPRHKLDESMYRHTVAQRDAAWREVEYWQRLCETLQKNIAQLTSLQASPMIKPMMLAVPESYEAGRQAGMREEREACAKQLDALGNDHCAAAIRARSQP